MIRAGIAGASGFAGGELLRLLLAHPAVKIAWVSSERLAGQPVSVSHADLAGETELHFSASPDSDADVVFLCLAHGASAEVLERLKLPRETTIIDLSQDHRLAGASGWIYGLPELNRERIRGASCGGARIANPGCFATALQIGILPVAAAGLLPDELHSSAVTGSTGAGAGMSDTLHFSWRASNMQVYKPFDHQHLPEVRQSLVQLQPGFTGAHRFIPYRGPFTRGIIASTYFRWDGDADSAKKLYADFYSGHPFVSIADEQPDLKQVVNTNRCIVHLSYADGQVLAVSVLDNLLKGAAGQAVQNMNLLCGRDESEGLRLKASAY
ncbi:MAG: N-acetyl-gamma-glutamyl-phosphate reductase [Bacteroidia bacterium]|nr:N-acetyl-gamma-glutamyl-phosphate reductase [Bacteroidia bacterium]